MDPVINQLNHEQEHRDVVDQLVQLYRGLREEDLPVMCPEYSCIICGKEDCPFIGTPRKFCDKHTYATEEQFSKRYPFSGVELNHGS